MTAQLIETLIQRAEQYDRPVKYIESPSLRKEDYTRSNDRYGEALSKGWVKGGKRSPL